MIKVLDKVNNKKKKQDVKMMTCEKRECRPQSFNSIKRSKHNVSEARIHNEDIAVIEPYIHNVKARIFTKQKL